MDRLRIATAWLGGCSGCHMSFLDLDEWLFELARIGDVVYSPLVDAKEYPEGVDLCLVEGAVANHDNLELLRLIRKRTKVIVAFGDCAITGNVTAMRNPMGGEDCVLKRSYLEGGDIRSRVPGDGGVLPPLLDRVEPIHVFVPVDYYLQGCPPSANRIKAMLEEIIEAATPQLTGGNVTFG